MKKIILILLSALFIMSAVNIPLYGWKKEETSQTEFQFYPLKPKNKNSSINKEQNWQLLYELLGHSQFAVKSKWLDRLLGEKQEPDPFIDMPVDMFVVEGKAFVLDQGRKSVWVYDFGGKKSELKEIKRFGNSDFGGAYGMDTDEEVIYMTFPGEQKIRVFDFSFEVVGELEYLFIPMRIKVSGDKLYVVDTGLQRHLNQNSPESVFVLDKKTGEVLSVIGMPDKIWRRFLEIGDEALKDKELQQSVPFSAEAIKKDHERKKTGDILLYQPSDVDVDKEGNIYVAEERGGRILKLNPKGKFIDQFGIRGADIICFEEVVDVAVAPNGDVYALDAGITMKGMSRGIVETINRPYIKFFSNEKWKQEKAGGNLACLPHSIWGGESIQNKLVGDKVPNMAIPYKIVVDTNKKNLEYFQKFVSADFDAEYLIWIAGQGGGVEKVADKIISHGKIMVFAYGTMGIASLRSQ